MKKKVLLTSILTIALCLSLIAGSTFALFTSESSVNIAVTAGKVNVDAEIGELTLYSMGVKQTGNFENGGTAAYDATENKLTLTNITPGDKVEFPITVTNNSNVTVQYRIVWSVSGKLAEVLEAKADGEKLVNGTTEWKSWTTADKSTKEIAVSVELPVDTNNDYQEQSANIIFTVEVVQGNGVPALGKTQYASTPEGLKTALANGGKVVLNNDITVSETLEIPEGVETTLDLNGNTITGVSHKSVGAVLTNNGTLTITGGTISSTAPNGGSAVENNGTLTVIDSTLNGASNADGSWPSYTVNNTGVMTVNNAEITSVHGAVCSYGAGAVLTLNDTDIAMAGIPGFTSHGIYTYNGGKTIVNGGNIANNAADQNATGGSVINGDVTVYSGTFTGRVENYYGTPVLYGGTYSVNPKASFIATGFKAVEKNGSFYIVPNSTDNIIVTPEDLATLGGTNISGTYELLADIDMTGYDMKPIMLTSGSSNTLTFNGNDHKISNLTIIQDYQNGMYVAAMFNVLHSGSALTINDLTLSNVTSTSEKYAAAVVAYNSTTLNINLNDVDVDGATVVAETVAALVSYSTGNVNLTDCDVSNISLTGEVGRPEKVGAFIGTANTDTCAVVATNCKNNTTYDNAGRVINGAIMTVDGMAYVKDAKSLADVVANGATNIMLADGEYDVYGCQGKTLTINGSEKAVLKVMNEGEDGCDYAFGHASFGNVTFNGVTIDTSANTGNYKGYAYMNAVYNDCTFVGKGFATINSGSYVFNGCTFDIAGYIWTWGASELVFDECTFIGDSRAVLAHGGASTSITFNNCDFAATEKGFTGSGDNTSVVEIDPTGSNTYTIKFTGENTITENYSGWTRVKDGSTGHTITGVN